MLSVFDQTPTLPETGVARVSSRSFWPSRYPASRVPWTAISLVTVRCTIVPMPSLLRFDPRTDVSPFALFRALKEGRPPRLVDARPAPGPLTLAGAIPWPGPEWTPPAGEDVVLFDEDGEPSLDLARHLQAAGFPRVRALFGGLALYDFALDPEVVGAETFLVRRP